MYLWLLDADEIIDGERTRTWLESGEISNADAWSMLSHWYFLRPNLRAVQNSEVIPALFSGELLNRRESLFFTQDLDRNAFLHHVVIPKERSKTVTSERLVHHY